MALYAVKATDKMEQETQRSNGVARYAVKHTEKMGQKKQLTFTITMLLVAKT